MRNNQFHQNEGALFKQPDKMASEILFVSMSVMRSVDTILPEFNATLPRWTRRRVYDNWPE